VVMAADILGDDTERGGSIVVVPFFLHAGKHVARDIPNLLREGMARVPGITVRLGPHLGCLPELADLAAQRAQHSARPHG
jgi:sirohydrochlorin ferrochelatase